MMSAVSVANEGTRSESVLMNCWAPSGSSDGLYPFHKAASDKEQQVCVRKSLQAHLKKIERYTGGREIMLFEANKNCG